MNLQRILTAVVLLAALVGLATGCTAGRAEAQSDSQRPSPLAIVSRTSGPSLMSGCTSSTWPPDCEIRTVRIQRAVGLYYIAPGTDVDAEMERMGAVFVNNGVLYDALKNR